MCTSACWSHDIITGRAQWSRGMYQILGLPAGCGFPPAGFGLSLYSPASRRVLLAVMADVYSRPNGHYDLPLTIRHGSGKYIPVRITARVACIDGVPALVTGHLYIRALEATGTA